MSFDVTKDDNVLNEIIQDAEEKPLSFAELNEKRMADLARLVNEQKSLEETIAEYETCLEELNRKLREVSEIKIPDIFDELGFDQVKLKTGEKVEIKRGFAATLSEENKPAAFKWLEETNNDGIIKHDVIVKLKKGESKEHDEIIDYLTKQGYTYEDKQHIHPATLKSFVTEQMEKGADIPQEVFKIFPIRKTKIKGAR